MADNRGGNRRARNQAATRGKPMPSILADTMEEPSMLIGIGADTIAPEDSVSNVNNSGDLENSMTYTQLERNIKGDSDNMEMLATMEREKYGTEIEVVNTLQEYFAEVDPRAPKHFINACLNLVESKGPEAVDGFLKAKYGVSPFANNYKRDDIVSISTDKEVMSNCRNLISTQIASTKNVEQLKPLIFELYTVRDDLQAQDETIVIDAICSWTYRYGVHFLSGKLEIFYLGSVESEDQTMVEVLRTLPQVPFHDDLARRTFLEKHKVQVSKRVRKPSQAKALPVLVAPEPIKISSDSFKRMGNKKNKKSRPAPEPEALPITKKGSKNGSTTKENTVYLDEDTTLDKEEVAFLWIHVYRFYHENNYAKGSEIELVKQTENSVYYILQHGLEGFNGKIADKFGRRFMNLVFALPEPNEDLNGDIIREVNDLYVKGNEAQKSEAKGKGRKASKRSFNKLIEALNFKFTNAQKQKKAKKPTTIFQNLTQKARNTEMSFRRLAMKGKSKIAQPEHLLEKKIKLFILQSMKTPMNQVDKEAKALVKLQKTKGSRVFKTRLKITYGGQFEQLDFMTEEQVDEMLERILNKTPHEGNNSTNPEGNLPSSAQFVNIYKDLSFHRNPETQLRYNKV